MSKLIPIKQPGWKAATMHYLIKCRMHGYRVTYPQGYDMVLHCPDCVKEAAA